MISKDQLSVQESVQRMSSPDLETDNHTGSPKDCLIGLIIGALSAGLVLAILITLLIQGKVLQ